MRSRGGGSGDALGAPVELGVRAEQVDRYRSPDVGDGGVAAVDSDGGRSGQPAEAEFPEQGEEPAFTGDAGGAVSAGSFASSAWNDAQAPCSSVQDRLMASRSRRPGAR